jgi:hypothetical protein
MKPRLLVLAMAGSNLPEPIQNGGVWVVDSSSQIPPLIEEEAPFKKMCLK